MELFSLLWPDGTGRRDTDFSCCAEDLELGRLSAILLPSMPMAEALQYADGLLTEDERVLTARHAVLEDLLRQSDLRRALEQTARDAEALRFYADGVRANAGGLTVGDAAFDGMKKFIDGLEKLMRKDSGSMFDDQEPNAYYAQLLRASVYSYETVRTYHRAVSELRAALKQAELRAPGLQALKNWADEIWSADAMEKTGRALEEISGWWPGISAFSVDASVSQRLDLDSFAISEVRAEPYAKTGLLGVGAEDGYDGLTGLISMPQGGTAAAFQEALVSELGIRCKTLLTRLRAAVIRLPITGLGQLLKLGEDLPFFTSAAGLCIKFREKGLPICTPACAGDAGWQVAGAYSTELALLGERKAVANDILLQAGGAVNVITGANNAGKTTYLITVGQLQWLFQLGCLLPAERAALRPVDALFTLFAAGESETGADSRMGLEVQRIGQIKEKMTAKSMVLLNEPMTSTSAVEGVEICVDLLCDLLSTGVSVMVVTHYNEIYALTRARLSGTDEAGRVRSFVMAVEPDGAGVRYTYRLEQAPPGRSSYAFAVVSRLGLTLDGMLAALGQAGMDMHADSPAWSALHPDSKSGVV